jgi:hypothetical protein
MKGCGVFEGELTASKLIIKPNAMTNLLFDKVEFPEYNNKVITVGSTDINSTKLATAPGRQIRVDYEVKGESAG